MFHFPPVQHTIFLKLYLLYPLHKTKTVQLVVNEYNYNKIKDVWIFFFKKLWDGQDCSVKVLAPVHGWTTPSVQCNFQHLKVGAGFFHNTAEASHKYKAYSYKLYLSVTLLLPLLNKCNGINLHHSLLLTLLLPTVWQFVDSLLTVSLMLDVNFRVSKFFLNLQVKDKL